jgi:hypothetical protein
MRGMRPLGVKPPLCIVVTQQRQGSPLVTVSEGGGVAGLMATRLPGLNESCFLLRWLVGGLVYASCPPDADHPWACILAAETAQSMLYTVKHDCSVLERSRTIKLRTAVVGYGGERFGAFQPMRGTSY